MLHIVYIINNNYIIVTIRRYYKSIYTIKCASIVIFNVDLMHMANAQRYAIDVAGVAFLNEENQEIEAFEVVK